MTKNETVQLIRIAAERLRDAGYVVRRWTKTTIILVDEVRGGSHASCCHDVSDPHMAVAVFLTTSGERLLGWRVKYSPGRIVARDERGDQFWPEIRPDWRAVGF